jgi:hypothetical protein
MFCHFARGESWRDWMVQELQKAITRRRLAFHSRKSKSYRSFVAHLRAVTNRPSGCFFPHHTLH